MAETFRIGTLARRLDNLGCTVGDNTLVWLVDTFNVGTKPSPTGHRRFTSAEVDTVADIVRTWQSTGLTFEDLAELVTAAPDRVVAMQTERVTALLAAFQSADRLRHRLAPGVDMPAAAVEAG